jgi:hypothetical protein
MLRAPHEKDIAVPESPPRINFLNAQKSFDSLVLGKRIVFVPVDPIIAFPTIPDSISGGYITVPPIELVHVPSVMEIRHMLMSVLYQFVVSLWWQCMKSDRNQARFFPVCRKEPDLDYFDHASESTRS